MTLFQMHLLSQTIVEEGIGRGE